MNSQQQGEIKIQGGLFNFIINLSNRPLIIFSEDGGILAKNEYAEQLLGDFSKSGYLHFNDIFDDEKNTWQQLMSFIAQTPQNNGYNFLHRLKNENKDHLPVEVNLKKQENHGLTYYTVIIPEISMNTMDLPASNRLEERIRVLEDEIKKSKEELTQFTGIASHDVQEPLRMVTSYLQLLKKNLLKKNDPDFNDFIDFALDGANRMQIILNDLLEYSRIYGRGKLFQKLDCNEIVKAAIDELKAGIKGQDVKIHCEKLPELKADDVQLIKLFRNIIGNAIKFRSENPLEIVISCEDKNTYYQFSISDNGIGIPRMQQDRIFEIFQRIHPRSRYPGTGMGLAICKKIVERHGGKIWVNSEEEKGSEFIFIIPKIA
jgi:signal transduction histidine kinase